MSDLTNAELDLWIAEHVMGRNPSEFGRRSGHTWKLDETGQIDDTVLDFETHNGPGCARCGYSFCHHCGEPDPECSAEPKSYSTHLLSAWGVVRAMGCRKPEPFLLELAVRGVGKRDEIVLAGFRRRRFDEPAVSGEQAASAPRAICLAARAAILRARQEGF